jgi:LPXTG-site transpeptidase (sortase) family protein
MRATRLLLFLLALTILLMVSAQDSSISDTAQFGAGQANSNSVYQPEVPLVRAGNVGESLVPLRLSIPAIGVNAFVESLGLHSNGDLATPTQNPWEDVGWYDMGPHPGDNGSAVIDGHLDRPGGYPAVFWRLRAIQMGDDVQVTNKGGNTLHFRVTRIAYYSPDRAPLQDIFGNQGGRYLNLITCAGDWIPSQRQTTLRLVVYTTLV